MWWVPGSEAGEGRGDSGKPGSAESPRMRPPPPPHTNYCFITYFYPHEYKCVDFKDQVARIEHEGICWCFVKVC